MGWYNLPSSSTEGKQEGPWCENDFSKRSWRKKDQQADNKNNERGSLDGASYQISRLGLVVSGFFLGTIQVNVKRDHWDEAIFGHRTII